jgi:hypothetical protein
MAHLACGDGTAYAMLLTQHPSARRSTFLANQLAGALPAVREEQMRRQFQLILVALRTLGQTSSCRRDVVLLLGTHGPELSLPLRKAFDREGVTQYWRVPPLFMGVPSADKLHAWRLTNYTKVLVVDSDILILRSVEDAFRLGPSDDFAIAHHPYDMQQAQCGIPIERRGVGGFFVARPNLSTYQALLPYVRAFPAHHLEHYSEQTALACFFKNRTRTLPCSFLLDLGSPAMSSCSPGASPSTCLRKHRQNCAKFGTENMRRSCLTQPAESCDRFAGAKTCGAISTHVSTCGAWSQQSTEVRAVHYKGRIKPWPIGNKQRNNNWMCSPMRSGALLLANESAMATMDLADDFRWDAEMQLPGASRRGACLSLRRGLPVHWAKRRDGYMVARKCCHPETMMSAHWHAVLNQARLAAPEKRRWRSRAARSAP